MSKRKKADPNPDEAEEDDDDRNSRDKSRQQQQPPQKVYDFHKKTIEVYPPRLLELNRQFVASISSQVSNEAYSVLVGNCLDYVRQYFNYEDDLLQYSPWLASRLKQSRSNIVKCLQETIDVYEALARHDFDRIIEKNTADVSSDDSTSTTTTATTTNKTDTSAQSTSFQFRPSTTTSSLPVVNSTKPTPTTAAAAANDSSSSTGFNFSKPSTTTAVSHATSSTGFTFSKPTTTASDTAPSTGFTFSKPTTTTSASDSTPVTGFSFSKPPTTTASDTTPSTGFTFSKPTTTTSDSPPTTGFSFAKPLTTTSDTSPSTGFSFKMPTTTTTTSTTTTTTSPDKQTNASPFAFSIPNTGFGTPRFGSPMFGNSASPEKTPISSASSISFAPPAKFSFGSTSSVAGEQQGTTEDNEDEPSEPPEPEKVEHEADAKLTYRCRMGVNKGGKLIKRGPVQVVLKQANEKHQLIVRSDDTLGRLYLNIIWSKLIEMKKNSTKDLTFVCKLNPAMPEVAEGEFVMILFRFDNETDRNDAYEKLNKERT